MGGLDEWYVSSSYGLHSDLDDLLLMSPSRSNSFQSSLLRLTFGAGNVVMNGTRFSSLVVDEPQGQASHHLNFLSFVFLFPC